MRFNMYALIFIHIEYCRCKYSLATHFHPTDNSYKYFSCSSYSVSVILGAEPSLNNLSKIRGPPQLHVT